MPINSSNYNDFIAESTKTRTQWQNRPLKQYDDQLENTIISTQFEQRNTRVHTRPFAIKFISGLYLCVFVLYSLNILFK